jgi:predicted nucleotidyltransferase
VTRPSATTNELIARLRARAPELRRAGVAKLALFGSHARGEAVATSDLDLVMEPAPGRPFSLWSLGEARVLLCQLTAHEVDLVIGSDLSSELRARIAPDLIDVL